jgi:hypothetical protein
MMRDIHLPKLPAIEWAYLAGLIDGEGTINIDACRKGINARYMVFRQSLVFVSTTPALIDWVWTRLPFGSKCINRRRNKRWARQHRILYTNDAARKILRAIRPYLVLKCDQADVALAMRYSPTGRWGYTESIRKNQFQCWKLIRKVRGKASGKSAKSLVWKGRR